MDRVEIGHSEPTVAGRDRFEAILAHIIVAACSVVLVCKEFVVPLEVSSRGVILEMLRVGSVSSNYPVFGGVIDLITAAFGRDRLALEALAHSLFLSSSVVWIAIMLELLRGRTRETLLVAIIIAIMLLNPVMIRFDLFAWRQSLSFAVFILGVIVTNGLFAKIVLIAISVTIHQGIAPVVVLFAIVSATPTAILWMVVPVGLVAMVVLHAIFPFQFLPAWMPFRLQLSDIAALSAADPSFNNAPGAIVEKYLATLVLPVSALVLAGRRTDARWVKLAMALSLPLIVGNFVPGANRFLYYSVFAATVCIVILFSEFIKRKYGGSSYWAVALAVAMNSTVLLSMQS